MSHITDTIDENQQVVDTEGTVQQDTPEQTAPTQEDAHLQSDTQVEPDRRDQAFYDMRKKLEAYEEREREQEANINLIDLARGSNSEPVFTNPMPRGVEFDQTDPATQAFLEQAQSAQQAAAQAKQEALNARAQMEDFEAWQKYPELNPKSTKRDIAFAKDVQKEYITSRLEAVSKGKQAPRLVDVADSVTKRYEEIRNQAMEQAATRERENLAQKEAASLESQGTRVNLQDTADETRIEQLRDRVRRGDINALTELNKLQDPYIQSIPDDAAY